MAAPTPFQNLIINVSPGERIFTEGEVGTTMFIVQSGRIRLFHEDAGKPALVAEMEKGDFFGEMSLLEATPRSMSAEAIDGAELIEINSTTFDRMIRSNIEIAVRMLRKLSGRLQKTEGQLASLRKSVDDGHANDRSAEPAGVGAAVSRAVGGVTSATPMRLAQEAPSSPRSAAVSPKDPSSALTSSEHTPAHARATPANAPETPAPMPLGTATSAQGAVKHPGASQGHGSLSATRPPTRSMMEAAGKTSAPAAASVRIFPTRPAAGQGPRLVSESGETIFPLSTHEALLGRYDPVTETQPEVDLTLIDIKRSVSRRHARITMKEGAFYLVEEVGALNGTFINGVKIVTGEPSPLKDNDRVSVGTVNLVFRK